MPNLQTQKPKPNVVKELTPSHRQGECLTETAPVVGFAGLNGIQAS